MPSPHGHCNSQFHCHVAVAAVLCLCAAALAAPRTTAAATATGVGLLPLPPPHSSVFDDNGCLRWCGNVQIPYPFGVGPAENCSAAPEFRLHCNGTRNGAHNKLFLGVSDWSGTDDSIEVVGIDVVHGQMRVVSQIFYSCFIYDGAGNTKGKSEDSSPRYYLPEPYRFSRASNSNKFIVLGCLTVTYMLGDAFDGGSGDDYGGNDHRWYMAGGCVADCRDNSSLKHPTDASCTGTGVMGCCQGTIKEGDESLRYYYATFDNMVNTTDFNTTYPCAYAMLIDSSYHFNFSMSSLAPKNEFNNSRVPVVVDWEWVIPNQTCGAAQTQPDAGYACVSDHSKCVDNVSGGRGYVCQCTKGFQGNPYVMEGCQAGDGGGGAPAQDTRARGGPGGAQAQPQPSSHRRPSPRSPCRHRGCSALYGSNDLDLQLYDGAPGARHGGVVQDSGAKGPEQRGRRESDHTLQQIAVALESKRKRQVEEEVR